MYFIQFQKKKKPQVLLTPSPVFLLLHHFCSHQYSPMLFPFFEIGTLRPKRKLKKKCLLILEREEGRAGDRERGRNLDVRNISGLPPICVPPGD